MIEAPSAAHVCKEELLERKRAQFVPQRIPFHHHPATASVSAVAAQLPSLSARPLPFCVAMKAPFLQEFAGIAQFNVYRANQRLFMARGLVIRFSGLLGSDVTIRKPLLAK